MGLGLGRPFDRHSARTEENYCCFLSNGIEGAKDRTEYAAVAEKAVNPNQKKMLLEGERIRKNPAIVRRFLECLPMYDVPAKYVVMKPLSLVQENETIQTVTFLANADQISALSLLADYNVGTITDSVVVAAGVAGCQALGVCTYRGSCMADPRAVIGLTDIAARRMTRKQLGKDKLTFSVPFELYCALLRDGEERLGKFPRIGRMEGAEGREITDSGRSNTNIIFAEIKEGNYENSRCAVKPKRQKK